MSVTLKKSSLYIKDGRDYQDVSLFSSSGTIEKWLDNHPEATTSVQDGSITEKKLNSALSSKINGEINRSTTADAQHNAQIAILSSRMDTFTRLPDGSLSTAADAELQDIRVKTDGKIASTAGTAVREQFTELKNDFISISEVTRNLNTAVMGRYLCRNNTGVIEAGSLNQFGMASSIPCMPETRYTVSVGDITYEGTLRLYITWFDASKAFISRDEKTITTSLYATKQSPTGAAYMHAYCYCNSGITIIDTSWIQIEEGTATTDHVEPYAPVGNNSFKNRIDALEDIETYETLVSRDIIAANTDLNDYKTPGMYTVTTDDNAATIANYPAAVMGDVIIFNTRGSNSAYSYGITQIVVTTKPPYYAYYRSYRSSTWRNWQRFAVESDINTAVDTIKDAIKHSYLHFDLPDNPYKSVGTKTNTEDGTLTWSDKVKDIKSTTHVHITSDVHFNKMMTKGYEHLAISNYHASIPAVPITDILPTVTVPAYYKESPNAEHVYFTGEVSHLHMNAIGSYLMSGSDNTGAGSGGYDGTVDSFLKKAIGFLRYSNGGGVSINHPKWSGLTADKIIELYDKGGIFAIEIYNASCEYNNQNGYALELWDAVLSTGRQLFGLAVPDHAAQISSVPAPDWETLPFGYNHMLCRTTDDQQILIAYRNGRFYTTINNDTLLLTYYGIDNNTVTIRTSEAGNITFKTATRTVSFANTSAAALQVTSADIYVRASCETATNKLFTNAIML